MSDPSIKTLRNSSGKTITLEPDKITIVGDGVQIILSDGDGISIISDTEITLAAEEKVAIQGKEILITGDEKLEVSCNGR